MNTVISIQYKNYTENEIVTEDNLFDVIDLLLTDKKIINFEYVIEGDVNLDDVSSTDFLFDYNTPSKVETIEGMNETLEELRDTYCYTRAEERRNELRIEKLEKRVTDKTWNLNNIERLFI